MTDLAQKKCAPCRGEAEKLGTEEIQDLLRRLDGWAVVDDHHLEKRFEFENFARALEFVNAVGGLAEEEDHHPDIWFTWGKAKLEIRTHKIDGLSENDFILAAKIDQLDAA